MGAASSGSGSIDPYWENVELLIQPPDDAVDGSTYVTDFSSNNFTVSVYGSTQIDTSLGYPAVLFDGDLDYLTVASSALLAFGSGDFTVDIELIFSSLPANSYIFDFGTNGGVLSVSAGKLRFYNPTTGVSGSLYTAGPILSLNTMYNICVERWGGITTVYVNGSAKMSQADSRVYPSAILNIGRYGGGGYYIVGRITRLRVTVGAARWKGSYTPQESFPIG